MNKRFEVATGTITGTEHRRLGKNNQDAHYCIVSEDYTIAIVCDGCGSRPHSEVGAKIGARLAGEVIAKKLSTGTSFGLDESFWQQVQQDILCHIHSFATAMGGDFFQTIQDYFLFTILGVIFLSSENATIFSVGDGVIFVNGIAKNIEKFSGNAPAYLAYKLLDKNLKKCDFKINYQTNIHEIESILIGTDGVHDLVAAKDKKIPGKAENVGSISRFWQEDRYFKNPDMIHRHLALLNRDIYKPEWQKQQLIREMGLLPDDTTLIVIRKVNSF